MHYTLYKIDDLNKIIYVKYEDGIENNDIERIVNFANENNYTIDVYEKTENLKMFFHLESIYKTSNKSLQFFSYLTKAQLSICFLFLLFSSIIFSAKRIKLP